MNFINVGLYYGISPMAYIQAMLGFPLASNKNICGENIGNKMYSLIVSTNSLKYVLY